MKKMKRGILTTVLTVVLCMSQILPVFATETDTAMAAGEAITETVQTDAKADKQLEKAAAAGESDTESATGKSDTDVVSATGETDENGEAIDESQYSKEDLEDATREDSIATILDSNPEDANEPNREKPEYADSAYTKDFNFTETTLHGIFSSYEIYFNVPDYWQTDYVYAEVQYNVSQLIESVASSMTFTVNNVPVASCKVSYEGGDSQTVYIKIPMELVIAGYNSLGVSAYAKLYDEDGCIDDFSGANWLSLSADSYVRCGYDVMDANNMISYYPYPFMSTTEETGKGLTIAVSDKATDGEIAAAMNLMSDLSTETGEENNIQFTLLSDIAASNPDRTIIVADYDNLPSEYSSLISDTKNLDEYAQVFFTDDSKGNPLLIVTSKDDACLLEAAYMLMDENRVDQEKSDHASVKLGSADIAVNSTSLSQMVAGNYTVGDIIGSGLTFVGPFHQEQNIYLPFSEDYFLSDAGKVSLKFRYSDNLDFDRSMITVYWGDVPVSSKKLTEEGAAGDELTFAMPADVVGTSAGSIRIAFDLEIKDLICTPRQEEMPWAYVSDESVLFLPASTGIVLTFDLKPSPFRTDGKFNDLMLVISDNPTTDELNQYAQVVGMYGDGVDPYGTFYVKRSSEFSKDDSDYNIITIGTYENNAVLQLLNDDLYFSYDGTGTKFNSNEQLILSDTYSSDIAILQLLESPFATNRGVLAVTGSNTASLERVEAFMRDHDMRYSLSKDCVLIDKDLDTKAYQFITNVVEEEEPTMLGTLASNKQSLVFTIVATSVMLMLLLAVIIILIRVRMYHKKKED